MRTDGGILPPDRGCSITLGYFGALAGDLQAQIVAAVYALIDLAGEDGTGVPRVREVWLADPGVQGGKNSSSPYHRAIELQGGSIRIGVTACGFWSEFPFPRYIFASGGSDSAILSLHRFLHDSPTRKLALARIAKEVPKVLALACGLPVCDAPECYLCYHWHMEDFDRNRGLCGQCRERFTTVFSHCSEGNV